MIHMKENPSSRHTAKPGHGTRDTQVGHPSRDTRRGTRDEKSRDEKVSACAQPLNMYYFVMIMGIPVSSMKDFES